MKKEEFMLALEENLKEISYEERQAALRYYEEYFEDASDNEAAVDQLDSPEKIAQVIKDDLDIKLQLVRTSGDSTKQEEQVEKSKEESKEKSSEQTTKDSGAKTEPYVANKAMEPWKIVLIIIACLMLSPVVLGGAGGLVGVVFSILGVVFGISVAGIAIIVAGVACFVAGIATLFVSPLTGVMLLGAGMFLLGLGLLFLVFAMWFWGTAVPQFINWIRSLVKGNKKEATL